MMRSHGRSVEGCRPKPDYTRLCFGWLTTPSRFKDVVEVGLSGRSVEGSSHVEAESAIMDGQWKGESWCAKRIVTDGQ